MAYIEILAFELHGDIPFLVPAEQFGSFGMIAGHRIFVCQGKIRLDNPVPVIQTGGYLPAFKDICYGRIEIVRHIFIGYFPRQAVSPQRIIIVFKDALHQVYPVLEIFVIGTVHLQCGIESSKEFLRIISPAAGRQQ